jgi:hypothetical protein
MMAILMVSSRVLPLTLAARAGLVNAGLPLVVEWLPYAGAPAGARDDCDEPPSTRRSQTTKQRLFNEETGVYGTLNVPIQT